MDKDVYLRSPEPEDLDRLYRWENDESFWLVSQTHAPFSKNTLKQFIDSPQDIYTNQQLRLMICTENDQCIGCVDWFDFDQRNLRSGIGILITPEFQQKGYGKAALTKAIDYSVSNLLLHQLYCDVPASNAASIKLFKTMGFQQNGTRKHWIKSPEGYLDTCFFQKML